MPLIVLALAAAPATEARGAWTPLPPLAVEASAADGGTLVTWLPPLSEGAGPLVAYHVYRLSAPEGGLWERIGSTGPGALSLLDASAGSSGAVYSVAAVNGHGQSLQSAPASAPPTCGLPGLSGAPPQPVASLDCLGAQGAVSGDGEGDGPPGPSLVDSLCSVVGLSGTPPQPVVNLDCLGTPANLKILHLER